MMAARSAAGLAKMLPGRVAIDDVGSDDLHRHREPAARVDDAADLPAAEQRSATRADVAAEPAAPAERQRIQQAQVERVADVEVVVAVLVLELLERAGVVAGGVRLVRAARGAAAAAERVLHVHRQPVAERRFSDSIIAL